MLWLLAAVQENWGSQCVLVISPRTEETGLLAVVVSPELFTSHNFSLFTRNPRMDILASFGLLEIWSKKRDRTLQFYDDQGLWAVFWILYSTHCILHVCFPSLPPPYPVHLCNVAHHLVSQKQWVCLQCLPVVGSRCTAQVWQGLSSGLGSTTHLCHGGQVP